MGAADKAAAASHCAAASTASAAPEGELRRRRGTRGLPTGAPAELQPGRKLPEEEGAETNRGGSSRVPSRRRKSDEAAASSTPDTSEASKLRAEEPADASAGEASREDSKNQAAPRVGTEHQPAASRLFIQVTPKIREFLETRVPPEERRELRAEDRIDLDVLQRLVQAANKKEKKTHLKVDMADLVEGSQVVGRIEAPKVPLEQLSFSERLRLMAEERRHQAAVRSLWGHAAERQDTFADLNKSLACVSVC
ncbi:hypothetical protein Efla_006471 [Eimeria flavescens]